MKNMFFELSILVAIGAMLCWGFGDFFIQKVVRKIGNLEALAFIGIIGSIGLIPFILKDLNLLFSFSNLILLLWLGILTFIVAMTNFEALKKGKLSVVEVILEFELPVTILLAFIFLKESLSLIQAIMVLLIFTGLILIALKSYKKNILKSLEKGVILGFVTAIGMGVINFLTGISAKQIAPLITIWVTWIIFTVISLVFIFKNKDIGKFIKNFKKFKTIILFMGVFDTLAWVFYAIALAKNEVAITTAITESYPAIAMFLGILINKEKIKWYQYAGAIVALISSVVLALSI